MVEEKGRREEKEGYVIEYVFLDHDDAKALQHKQKDTVPISPHNTTQASEMVIHTHTHKSSCVYIDKYLFQ